MKKFMQFVEEYNEKKAKGEVIQKPLISDNKPLNKNRDYKHLKSDIHNSQSINEKLDLLAEQSACLGGMLAGLIVKAAKLPQPI